MKNNFVRKIPKTENIYSIGQGQFGPDPGTSYLINSPKKILIETGTSKSVPSIVEDLNKIGVSKLDYIALTHIHLDHAGGASFLSKRFPEARILVHKKGVKHLIDPSKLKESVERAVGKLFDLYGSVKPIQKERIISLSGNEEIDLGNGYKLKPIDSPGHAPHHLCYYESKERVLFTGDAAGIYYPKSGKLLPSTPPPNFDLEEELKTIKKLKKLPAKFLAYTHTGWKSDPQESLEKYENLLKEWVSEIMERKDEIDEEKSLINRIVEKYTPIWAESEKDKEIMKGKIKMDVEGVLLYLKKKSDK